jgi:hypothetical protein
MNGDELLKSLKILQEGKLGLYPSYGLQQTVSISSGKNVFIKAKFSNG